MNFRLSWRWQSILIVALLATSGCSSQRRFCPPGPSGPPASPAEAAKVIDLSVYPLSDGATSIRQRTLGNLSYNATGEVKPVFEAQRKRLLDAKWQELPDSSVTAEYASAMFTRDGFKLSLSVSPSGQPGEVMIFMNNLGNVALAKLPVPPGTKPLYQGPASAMYVNEGAVDPMKAAVRDLLTAQGWQAYGSAGDTQYFKQNAIRLLATVNSAPAQGNKTAISYTAELMGVDLPAPDFATDINFADPTKRLEVLAKAEQQKFVDYYRAALAKTGWKSTMEKPVEVDKKQMMIFRNEAGDMITLELDEFMEQGRATLKHQSAAELAEIERLIKKHQAEAEEKKKAEGK